MSTKLWTTVSLPKDLVKELYEICAAEDRTREAVVRRAIRLYRAQSEYMAAVRSTDNQEALATTP
jgi:metal-responsive CopG/Arc/MetJ family transcriptional regulator